MKNLALIILTILLLLSGCKKTPVDNKVPPAVKPSEESHIIIKVSPTSPRKGEAISADVQGVPLKKVRYQWKVNGTEIDGANSPVFKGDVNKHDIVLVEVTVEGEDKVYVSEEIIIENTPPRIQTSKLIPRNPKIEDELSLEVNTFDEDDDPVSLSYEWFVNGESSGETSESIILSELSVKRGDKISVKITPADDEDEGPPITLYTNVINSPPKVLPDIKAGFDGSLYTSRVIANDPDEDTLSFALKDAPAGMTINPQTGVITWEVKPENKGEHNIIVSVSDGNGGETIIPFTARITFAPPPPE